ncbi:MAG: Osmolarity sensor protein EnvZ [Pseudomonadota bacterium]
MNPRSPAAPDTVGRGAASLRPTMGLFWRTFLLLALLILGSTISLLQLFRLFEYEPSTLRNAYQIATVVNLTRNALQHTDPSQRTSLLQTLSTEEDFNVVARQPSDTWASFAPGTLETKLAAAVTERLGEGTIVASRVNGERGLWVGLTIDRESYWLQMDYERMRPIEDSAWLLWLLITSGLSLAGALFMARWVNRPLRRLFLATGRLREGQYHEALLREDESTRELAQLTQGFNRMVHRLSKAEEDRALMLAGLSHDLRTPLARLRLETELSVPDAQAREAMATDIEQMDGIIGQFLDYGRRAPQQPQALPLREQLERDIAPFVQSMQMDIRLSVPTGLLVEADPVALGRVISNLLENARRYGKSAADDRAHVTIQAARQAQMVWLQVRDHGPGVTPDLLPLLTQPFLRGEKARTSAAGAGLGLSIVERIVQQAGGQMHLTLPAGGGLAIDLLWPMAKAGPRGN